MGNASSAFACIRDNSTDNTTDLSPAPIRSRNLPCIWVIGQQNTGKKTHGELIKSKFDFEHINITDLLRTEAEQNNQRSKTIEESLRMRKKVNDHFVIQVLKETLLKSTNENGYVISNFPKNSKQADMFVKEISNVNFIFYLYADIVTLLNRAQARSDGELNETTLKKDFTYATRDIKTSLQKFVSKIENVNTSSSAEVVFHRIQNTIVRRLQLPEPIPQEAVNPEDTESVLQSEPITVKELSTEPEEAIENKDLPASSGDEQPVKSDQGDNILKEEPSEENRVSYNESLASDLFEDPSSKISQNSDTIVTEHKETETKSEPLATQQQEVKEDEELLDSYYS